MIGQRRLRHPNLRSQPRPNQWSDAQREQTPEAKLLDRVERYCWLSDAGLDEQQAIHHMGGRPNQSLHDFMVEELGTTSPHFAGRDGRQFQRCLNWARLWAELTVDEARDDSGHLTSEMLKRQVNLEQIERGLPVQIGIPSKDPVNEPATTFWFRTAPADGDWKELLKRHAPGDEFWNYEAWSSDGIALVRNGRIVGHATTVHLMPVMVP